MLKPNFSLRPKSSRFARAASARRQSDSNVIDNNDDVENNDDKDSSCSLPISLPQSLSSQIVFGQYGPDNLRPSASFDSLGALYDAQWAPKNRIGVWGGGGNKVETIQLIQYSTKRFSQN